SDIPANTKHSAVSGFMVAMPGSTLVRTGTSNPQPTSANPPASADRHPLARENRRKFRRSEGSREFFAAATTRAASRVLRADAVGFAADIGDKWAIAVSIACFEHRGRRRHPEGHENRPGEGARADRIDCAGLGGKPSCESSRFQGGTER